MTSKQLTVTTGLDGEKVTIPTGLFIDNQFVPSIDGSILEVQNASTRALIGSISAATAKDVDLAVASSLRAYRKGWRTVTAAKRRQLMLRLADLIERDLGIFAILEGSNVGALRSTTTNMLGPLAVEWLRYFAGWTDKIDGRSAAWDSGDARGGFAYTRREPYGVTGAIVPWNTPL